MRMDTWCIGRSYLNYHKNTSIYSKIIVKKVSVLALKTRDFSGIWKQYVSVWMKVVIKYPYYVKKWYY